MFSFDEREIDLDLRSYLAILRRHRLQVVVCTLLTLLVAGAITVAQSNRYEATADLLVESRSTGDIFSTSSSSRQDADRELDNQVEFLKSTTVFNAVTTEIGEEPEVTVTTSNDGDVISVTASAGEPERAADVANVYAETYLSLRKDKIVDDYAQTSAAVQSQISAIDGELRTLDRSHEGELVEIDDSIADARRAIEVDRALVSGLEQQRSEIVRRQTEQRAPLISQRAVYTQGLTTLQLNTDLASGAIAQVISEAEAPEGPASPRPVRNLILGALAGLLLGVGAAFALEQLDDAVVTPEDLGRATDHLPILATIPQSGKERPWHRDKRKAVERTPAITEAFRSFRTSLQFAALDTPLRVVQVTSALPGEGKSVTTANLGRLLAEAGKRICIIDTDLRRSSIHNYLDVEVTSGYPEYLLGNKPLNEIFVRVDPDQQLYLLPAGNTPPDPAQLLSTRAMAELIDKLAGMFDLVLVDSPPVRPVSDPLIVSKLVDGVVVVARSGVTKREEIHESINALRRVGAPLLGTVLNSHTAPNEYKRSSYYLDETDSASELDLRDLLAGQPANNRAIELRDSDISKG